MLRYSNHGSNGNYTVMQYKFYLIQNVDESEFRFSQIMANLNSDLAKLWLNLNSDLAKSGHRSYMMATL